MPKQTPLQVTPKSEKKEIKSRFKSGTIEEKKDIKPLLLEKERVKIVEQWATKENNALKGQEKW